MNAYYQLIFFIIFSLNSKSIFCQNDLSILDDFLGKKWIGHYQNSEDSNLVHIIKWKYDFDKQVIKEIKSVPEVNFYSETFYYLDHATNKITYVSFMNRAMISKGTVTKSAGKLELSGKSFFKNGFQENKKTYEITGNGKLEDYFFRKSRDKWVQGHFVLYTSKNIIPPGMVTVNGGSFQMGDIFGDGDKDELPVHQVNLNPFYVSKYETTVGEFREFIASANYITTAEKEKNAKIWKAGIGVINDSSAYWDKVGFEQTDLHPVVLVSWLDAIEYCNWRSLREGFTPCYKINGDSISCDFEKNGYRLLTSAEWEFIARDGGKKQKYAWGNGDPYINKKKAANIRDLTLGEASSKKGIWHGYADDYVYSAPVGSFAPNGLGIYDLTGNVYEWCWDWFEKDYYKTSPSDNPEGAKTGQYHSCRGGGFICYKKNIRVVNRGKGEPTLAFSWGGFRIARTKL